jgi:hypothetical protein
MGLQTILKQFPIHKHLETRSVSEGLETKQFQDVPRLPGFCLDRVTHDLV